MVRRTPWKMVLVMASGILIGRFVVPALEGREFYGIQLFQDSNRGCSMLLATETKILGRHISTAEGSNFAACGQVAEIAPHVRVVCDCEGAWMR